MTPASQSPSELFELQFELEGIMSLTQVARAIPLSLVYPASSDIFVFNHRYSKLPVTLT